MTINYLKRQWGSPGKHPGGWPVHSRGQVGMAWKRLEARTEGLACRWDCTQAETETAGSHLAAQGFWRRRHEPTGSALHLAWTPAPCSPRGPPCFTHQSLPGSPEELDTGRTTRATARKAGHRVTAAGPRAGWAWLSASCRRSVPWLRYFGYLEMFYFRQTGGHWTWKHGRPWQP